MRDSEACTPAQGLTEAVKTSPSVPMSFQAAVPCSGDISEDLGSISVAVTAQQLGAGQCLRGVFNCGVVKHRSTGLNPSLPAVN